MISSSPPVPGRTVYLVGCAAPPVRALHELIALVHEEAWSVCVIPTPVAATWIDQAALAAQTGNTVRSYQRHPDEPSALPTASAVVVVPATFNTINKWASGISDTFALGILNETLGLGLPIVVFPHAKPALTSHPAFATNVSTLRACGVRFAATNAVEPVSAGQPFRWSPVIAALRGLEDPAPGDSS